MRLFATDLDREAVDFARRGVYPASALREVPPELVARYFQVEDDTCRVAKTVRSLLVFATTTWANDLPSLASTSRCAATC